MAVKPEDVKVAVDAGHGSNTAGKRTAPFTKNVDIDGDGKVDVKKGQQYKEHYANVGICVFLEEELKRQKFKVIKTAWDDADPTDDPDVPLSERQKAIKNAKCNYSISIHFNAFGDGKSFNSAEGFLVYIHNQYANDSKALAEAVVKRMAQGTKQKNRGVASQAFAMCNTRTIGTKASILVECAFMTNEREAQELMANEAFWKECAVEICQGFCDYLGVKYIPEKKEDKGVIYRVQTGAYKNKTNAENYLKTVQKKFKDAYMKKVDGMYKVQVGAFSVKANAERLAKELEKAGFSTFITTK